MSYYKLPSFNIGIEEEYQFIDPESRELLGFATQSMGRDQMLIRERHPELDFAQRISADAIEVGTPICTDIQQARTELRRIRSTMLELGAENGFKLVSAGTHPFSHWAKEGRSPALPRSRALIEDTQIIARRLLAFGMHVHIGVEDRELAVDVMNAMRYVLPHILCMANSSPFWLGRDTGLASYRAVLLDALPRTGIPNTFESYSDYQNYIDTLIRTNSIPGPGDIWWDIRPHHRFPTLEIRICDALPKVEDALAVTALIQAVVAWMVDMRHRNMSFRLYERTLIAENKWRAVRYGLTGTLIDFGIEEEVPVVKLLREILERVEPMMDQLNSRDELEHVYKILERGTSTEEQRRVFRESDGDVRAVVDHLVAETENVP